jgi:hypothetical protein
MLGRIPTSVPKTPRSALPGFFDKAREFFAIEAVVHPNSELAWHALTLAQQLGTGHFQSVLNDGREFLLEYEDKQLPVIGKYTDFHTEPGSWLEVFFFGVMTGSAKAVSVLNQVDDEMMMKASLGPPTRYELALVALLKGVYDPEPTSRSY